MPKDTIEKVAIITAAGSGMGAASARTLANSGYKVSLLSPSGRAESLAQELNGIGMTGSNQSVDDLQKLVEATINEWGRVDVLLNSAGHGPRGDILSLSDDDWHKGLDVYLMNVIRAT
ncbi:MAG TPA: 3-oxoacyl-ACP reductase, partial [Pusillimonas sp.]|nr:3-oxoacyl-ACP reductase [Pusillimonas sp.]